MASIQQSFNQMLTSLQYGTGLKKYLKGQEAQTKATEVQTKVIKDYQETLNERKIAEAAKDTQYKEREAEAAGYSSPEQQFRWEEEATAEKTRQAMRGERALSDLEQRIDFLSNFRAAKKMRKSILLDAKGNQLEVEINGKQK